MFRPTALFLLGLLPSTSVWAFCGTYVGQEGDTLTNRTSQVVLVRQGDRTTLTLANDFEGDASEFAMLIPVPEVLEAADVKVLSPDVLGKVEAYSGPRLVEYSCDDFNYDGGGWGWGSGPGCGEEYAFRSDASPAAADTVEVESRFSVGEYEMVVLSAEESSGLLGWLDRHGFSVDPTAEDLL